MGSSYSDIRFLIEGEDLTVNWFEARKNYPDHYHIVKGETKTMEAFLKRLSNLLGVRVGVINVTQSVLPMESAGKEDIENGR